ncbi:MAG: ATP-binding protein [Daejeonella sp.]
MLLTNDFKNKVLTALQDVRQNYGGSDQAFAKQWGINNSVYSRLKNGELEGLLKDTQWLNMGRELGVDQSDRKWNMARTDVFTMIEEDVVFCQNHAKGKICVDDCGIGKTYSAKYLSRTLKNCFYVDASQAKTKQLFIRLIARTIGVDHQGKYAEVKANIKYYLKMLPNPIVIIDEAGDLDYPAFLELKELWNATEAACGWYLMGADGLREKIDRGIRSKKVGYRELFSRYSERYTTTVPVDRNEKLQFYKKLIGDVLSVNMTDKSKLDEIVKRCLTQDVSGQIGGLRRAESLFILNA